MFKQLKRAIEAKQPFEIADEEKDKLCSVIKNSTDIKDIYTCINNLTEPDYEYTFQALETLAEQIGIYGGNNTKYSSIEINAILNMICMKVQNCDNGLKA